MLDGFKGTPPNLGRPTILRQTHFGFLESLKKTNVWKGSSIRSWGSSIREPIIGDFPDSRFWIYCKRHKTTAGSLRESPLSGLLNYIEHARKHQLFPLYFMLFGIIEQRCFYKHLAAGQTNTTNMAPWQMEPKTKVPAVCKSVEF